LKGDGDMRLVDGRGVAVEVPKFFHVLAHLVTVRENGVDWFAEFAPIFSPNQ
jgi:hypothetical protein